MKKIISIILITYGLTDCSVYNNSNSDNLYSISKSKHIKIKISVKDHNYFGNEFICTNDSIFLYKPVNGSFITYKFSKAEVKKIQVIDQSKKTTRILTILLLSTGAYIVMLNLLTKFLVAMAFAPLFI